MSRNSVGTRLRDALGFDGDIVGEEKGFNPETGPEDAVGSVDKAEDAAPKAKPLPKTKAGMLKAAYDKLNGMKKDDVKKTLEKFMYEETEGEDDEDDEDEEESEVMSERKKKSKGHTTKESFEDDLNALVESEATLSEGFKEKAGVIFEAALNARVSDHIDRLDRQYRKEISEETQNIQEHMVDLIDQYFDYVVESWMEENRLAVENGLRSEITESFITSLKNVFTEHYVDVPESKIDLVDELASKNQQIEEELNRSVNRAMKLNEQVKTLTKEKIVREAAFDLSENQAEKLWAMAESLEFNNPEKFEAKIHTIKESYFQSAKRPDRFTSIIDDSEALDESDTVNENVSGRMELYLSALSSSKS